MQVDARDWLARAWTSAGVTAAPTTLMVEIHRSEEQTPMQKLSGGTRMK